MKLINPKIPTLALFMSLILMLFGSGCASGSGGSSDSSGGVVSGGSRTLKEVDLDVSPKMTTFHNAVAGGAAVTQGEKEQANLAYARYKTAYNQALQAADNNPNAPAPENVKALATEVVRVAESIQ